MYLSYTFKIIVFCYDAKLTTDVVHVVLVPQYFVAPTTLPNVLGNLSELRCKEILYFIKYALSDYKHKYLCSGSTRICRVGKDEENSDIREAIKSNNIAIPMISKNFGESYCLNQGH